MTQLAHHSLIQDGTPGELSSKAATLMPCLRFIPDLRIDGMHAELEFVTTETSQGRPKLARNLADLEIRGV